jgi:hypothetical protein
MSISARLTPKTLLALARYCKAHRLTKTAALERGIALLLRHEAEGTHHPAFLAYQRVRNQNLPTAPQRKSQESTRAIKRYLDEKHSG